MKLFSVMSTAFDSFDNTVHSYLTKTFASIGVQYSNNQIFAVIFNGLKGIMQNIMFYIEDAFTEQNIETAVRKKSIYSLAKQSGFEPNYGYTATGTLIGKIISNSVISEGSGTKIYIPNHTILQNTITGITYLFMLPTDSYIFDISKPLLIHEFKIIQGKYNTSKYTAIGKNLETVSVDTTGYWDKGYVKVFVNNIEYTQVANLYEMSEGGNEYIISIGYDNSFDIMFGNDVYGNKLSEGDTVYIEYISHSGAVGNILSTASYNFKFLSPGTDTYGNTIDLNNYMKLSINSCISGGIDSDDVDFVRNMIGYNSRSLVLASEENFKLFFKRFSFIGYINCWSEENSMNICVSCLNSNYNAIQNNTEYYDIDVDNLLLNSTQKELITSSLENSKKSFAGLTLVFKDPIIRKFSIICYIKVKSSYARETVKQNIANSIADYFMSIDGNTQFIAKSDIINKVITDDSNIESFDFDFISELTEECYKTGYYYRYSVKYVNGLYDYELKKVLYEEETSPGLDAFGNISLDSKLEIPFIHGGIKYYPNKTKLDKKTTITVEPIQYMFI